MPVLMSVRIIYFPYISDHSEIGEIIMCHCIPFTIAVM